jgi:transcription elongation factor GreA
MPEPALKKMLEDEIRALEYELNHDLPIELKKAVAHGDLSENAEYSAAKERQDFVQARLAQLTKRLSSLALVNFNNIPKDAVGFGSTVVVFDIVKEVEVVYKIVSSEETDVAKGMISTSSPIGRGLIGTKVGDTVNVQTPGGKKELEVLRLTTIHDGA